MPAYASETPIFLMKKLGGLLLLAAGILLMAFGLSEARLSSLSSGSSWPSAAQSC